jgi:hypothetical protein
MREREIFQDRRVGANWKSIPSVGAFSRSQAPQPTPFPIVRCLASYANKSYLCTLTAVSACQYE